MSYPTPHLRQVARFAYGDSLASENRAEGRVPVFGSNGQVGTHRLSNTLGPVVVVGRKGSHGKLQYSADPVFAIDTTFFVDQTCTRTNLKWLYYALSTLRLDELSADVGVPGLNRDDAYDCRIPTPSFIQQRAIADFLDAETTRIDLLIAARQSMILLTQQRSAALVSDELARCNGHGEGTRLKYLCGFPTSGNRDHAALQDDGVPCLRGFNVRPGRIDRRELLCISEVDNRRHAETVLSAGDIVIVRSGNAGSAACIPVDLDGCNCVDLVVVRRTTKLIPRFLELVLNSEISMEQVRLRSSGAILSHFNAVDAAEIRVPYTDLETQSRVVTTLDRQIFHLDSLVQTMNRQIEIFQERRQALIAAAVTGELRVAREIGQEPS